MTGVGSIENLNEIFQKDLSDQTADSANTLTQLRKHIRFSLKHAHVSGAVQAPLMIFLLKPGDFYSTLMSQRGKFVQPNRAADIINPGE